MNPKEEIMILNSQRTLYGANLSMNMLLGLPHTDMLNTTLNEKFNLNKNIPIPTGTYPTLKYMTIGTGGAYLTDAATYQYSKHRSTDAALFEHVPFIIRPITSDLIGVERNKYRLRVIETHNSIDYACYYAKVIPNIINKSTINELTTTNGLTSIREIPTSSIGILSPTPRVVTNYLDQNVNSYSVKSAKVEFNLYQADLNEIRSAMTIRSGTIKHLTEIGLVAGIDKVINNSIDIVNATMFYFAEIDIDTQVFIDTNTDLIRNIEIGGMEPILR